MTATVPGVIRRRFDPEEPVKATRTPHQPGPRRLAGGGRPRPAAATLGPWVNRAACRGLPEELWWPQPGKHAALLVGAEVCRVACPVRAECLTYAEQAGEYADVDGGTWGGLLPEERRELRAAGTWRPGEPVPDLDPLHPDDLARAARSAWARWLPARSWADVAARWNARKAETA